MSKPTGPQIAIPKVSPADVDQLVAEDKLLRILTPDVQTSVARMLAAHVDSARHLVQCEGQLYFTLAEVTDSAERARLIGLLRRYQLGEPVSLDALPASLRQLLQPNLTPVGRLLGALVLGAAGGFAIGVLAMAICTLILNALALSSAAVILNIAGMRITAVTFVIFSALGWAAATFIAWRRLRRRSLLSFSQNPRQ